MKLFYMIIFQMVCIAHQFMGSYPTFMFHTGQIRQQHIFGRCTRIYYRTFLACIYTGTKFFKLGGVMSITQSH